MTVDFEANYDEALVPEYTLPDPLVSAAGDPVTTAEQWRESRRPELLGLFAEHVYGSTPPTVGEITAEVVEEGAIPEGTRRQVRIGLREFPDWPGIDVLLFLPPDPRGIFVGLNFFGNHTVTADPAVAINPRWMADRPGVVEHRATESTRGAARSRWPVPTILARGYGLATAYCGDLFPDHADGYAESIAAALDSPGWGAVGAWAWGLSRIAEHLAPIAPLAVLGHSRLGKAALWAGAQDERFGLVISNESGCTGAAIARRRVGETVARINTAFPHWFSPSYRRYNDREHELPVDQHELIALMAPRPVHIASAEEDRWSDPFGEFLGGREANSVYELLGGEGLPADNMPAVGEPVRGRISYHMRAGEHDVVDYDWDRYLESADRFLQS
ncbi:MAG TPA: hypothetical protein VHC49_21970 [Mycobacteriales bacterium]|nr:hypothetical protein [Mycobacteriales bacterium]